MCCRGRMQLKEALQTLVSVIGTKDMSVEQHDAYHAVSHLLSEEARVFCTTADGRMLDEALDELSKVIESSGSSGTTHVTPATHWLAASTDAGAPLQELDRSKPPALTKPWHKFAMACSSEPSSEDEQEEGQEEEGWHTAEEDADDCSDQQQQQQLPAEEEEEQQCEPMPEPPSNLMTPQAYVELNMGRCGWEPPKLAVICGAVGGGSSGTGTSTGSSTSSSSSSSQVDVMRSNSTEQDASANGTAGMSGQANISSSTGGCGIGSHGATLAQEGASTAADGATTAEGSDSCGRSSAASSEGCDKRPVAEDAAAGAPAPAPAAALGAASVTAGAAGAAAAEPEAAAQHEAVAQLESATDAPQPVGASPAANTASPPEPTNAVPAPASDDAPAAQAARDQGTAKSQRSVHCAQCGKALKMVKRCAGCGEVGLHADAILWLL